MRITSLLRGLREANEDTVELKISLVGIARQFVVIVASFRLRWLDFLEVRGEDIKGAN